MFVSFLELSFSKTFESPLPAVFPPVSTSELIVLVPEEESQDWSLAPDSFARDSKDGIDYIRWDLKKGRYCWGVFVLFLFLNSDTHPFFVFIQLAQGSIS